MVCHSLQVCGSSAFGDKSSILSTSFDPSNHHDEGPLFSAQFECSIQSEDPSPKTILQPEHQRKYYTRGIFFRCASTHGTWIFQIECSWSKTELVDLQFF